MLMLSFTSEIMRVMKEIQMSVEQTRYMSAWQPILGNTVPWVPVVGNHEYYSGAELYRFLNQTFEGWSPIPGGNVDVFGGQSTADTSLGALLSIGNYHSAGKSGTIPSNTSRYF